MFNDFKNIFNIKDVEIKLERLMCDGPCPFYSLHIFGSGTLIYFGKANVKKIGQIETHFPKEKLFSILKKALELGFFGLRDAYRGTDEVITMDNDGCVYHNYSYATDGPTYILSIKIGDEIKIVVDYQGAPQNLKILENFIDEICQSYQWTGVKW